MSNHTKLPWSVRKGDEIADSEDLMTVAIVVHPIDDRKDADAKFIVRACNAHYDLLEVALLFKSELDLCMEMTGPLADKVSDLTAKVNAAINKAKGTE